MFKSLNFNYTTQPSTEGICLYIGHGDIGLLEGNKSSTGITKKLEQCPYYLHVTVGESNTANQLTITGYTNNQPNIRSWHGQEAMDILLNNINSNNNVVQRELNFEVLIESVERKDPRVIILMALGALPSQDYPGHFDDLASDKQLFKRVGSFIDYNEKEYSDTYNTITRKLFNLCGCGYPEAELRYIDDVLDIYRQGRNTSKRNECNKKYGFGPTTFMLHYLDSLGFAEHGTGAAGWLLDEGAWVNVLVKLAIKETEGGCTDV
ncbi:hypothetical protein FDJ06_gp147 [Pseudomonas phage SL2]|uniref:PHIKZ191 n=2 Tax=Phikzvirus TaxID=680115 RepID=Q8SCX1_BPDPK|nr:PHIKZ191 [Pseudomonas phage phiKZ]YP_009619687.1 hypothetical protein FDJ06_gp147 [Pseudomonas phage SL2]USL86810.1 hypothetical protein CDGHABPJ_00352 [Pseudomonas phage OMKO1]WNV47896.1 hypothetical protein [Pseudomonas phage fMGyn-Pae01]AAL83092.1 PHIKZ191 [Pseudomonas phage phiKZ]ATN94724.1 hypothetical protein SL2_147 [Pseudomonas phage SL2]